MAVYLKGERADEASALKRAADLLCQARLPVIGGLLTDIAGAEAALALARKLGGVIDHEAGEALSRSARLMRETGACPASFGEVRNRADVVIVIGEAPLACEPGLINELFPTEKGLPRPGDQPRELVMLGSARPRSMGNVPVTAIPLKDDDLPTWIARLAMAVAGRPIGGEEKLDGKPARLAERLRGAAFPVFVYSAGELDEPAIHVVLDMVRHLCVTTRAATLTITASGNGDGVNLCSAWTCGLPVRTRFVDGLPVHDPWLYATPRLIDSGEADALLWIDALEAEGASPPRGVPTVLLTRDHGRGGAAEIVIEVASAARDHDAELYLPRLSGIGVLKAAHASTAVPSAAATLSRIADLVLQAEAPSC